MKTLIVAAALLLQGCSSSTKPIPYEASEVGQICLGNHVYWLIVTPFGMAAAIDLDRMGYPRACGDDPFAEYDTTLPMPPE